MARRDLPVLAALGALNCGVALAFARVFDGSRWVLPLFGAALLPLAIAFGVRSWSSRANADPGIPGPQRARPRVWSSRANAGRASRTAASATVKWAASFVGMLVFAVLVLGTAAPGTFSSRLSDGFRVVEHHGLPLPATSATVTLAVFAVWLIATFAEHLAIARGASIGALGPGIAALIWIAALSEQPDEWLDLAVFGVAAVMFLALQHQRLMSARRTRLGRARVVDAPGLIGVALCSGVVAIVIGMAVAPALPGGQHPLFDAPANDNTGSSTYRTSVPPLLNVGDELKHDDRHELFTVKASSPDYWRITALDEYQSDNGGQWTLNAQGNNAVSQGLDGSAPKNALTQDYRISSLGERWMPAAYRPVQVSRSGTLVVRASSTLVTDARSVTGLHYQVVSDAPTLVLSSTQRQQAAAAPPAALAPYTAVPADLPSLISTTARQVTAGLTSPLDKARALRDFFRNGSFTYDPGVSLGDDQSALVSFLTTRRGFCVQFASAYAIMARVVGLPTRVAVGFTPGAKDAAGVYHVTNWEAHAWPEVWLAGLGWTHLFDPTPPSDRGGSDLPSETAIQSTGTPSTTIGTGATTPTSGSSATPPPSSNTPATNPGANPPANPPANVTITPNATDTSGGTTWLFLVIGLLALFALTPVIGVLVAKSRRRSRRRTARDPARSITGAWREAVDDLTDHRIHWPSSDTPLELAARVRRDVGEPAAPPMHALARAYGAIRYGNIPATRADAELAWRHVDSLREVLDRSTPLMTRLRARLDPATLRRQPEPAGWSLRRRSSTND